MMVLLSEVAHLYTLIFLEIEECCDDKFCDSHSNQKETEFRKHIDRSEEKVYSMGGQKPAHRIQILRLRQLINDK